MVTIAPALLLPLLGCATESKDYDTGFYDTGAWGNPPDDGSDFQDTGDDTEEVPPEEETDYLRLAPAATNAYVFVANPTRNTVTRIGVPSLDVLTAEVGEIPSVVATTADYERAVTLNEGDDSVSVLDADTLAVVHVPIRENMNALALSDDGQWAMAWFDPDRESLGNSGGVQSFNEVSFVNLATGVHTPLAVGFNPRGVRWSADGHLALVVSDASLAIIDLTAHVLDPELVELADDPTDAPAAEEVELSPGGEYAFVRQFGATDLAIVDIAGRFVERVPVGENPTDLDLSPDGGTVAVVSRGSREVWMFDATNPFAEPTVVPLGETYGSLLFTPDGTRAVLYTNAVPVDRFGVLDVNAGSIEHRSMVKPVESVALSPTGESLLVFHSAEDAEDADPEGVFYGKWAISLIDLGDFRQNPMVLPAEATSYAMSEDGRYGFFIMDGSRYLETLNFDNLLYEERRLASLPVHLGVLPGTDVAWASQDHELGRISFYDAATDNLDTITGFELNNAIEH